MSEEIKNITIWLCSVSFLIVTGFISISAISCKISPESIHLISGDCSTPELKSIMVTNTNSISLTFSKQIIIEELKIAPINSNPDDFVESDVLLIDVIENEISLDTDISYSYSIYHPMEILCSEQYIVFGTVKDVKDNTLTFSSIITGYNDKVPMLLLSELRTEWSKPKVEFIELFALTSGNTGGMVLESLYNNTPFYYIFPAAEVEAGEYILLHLRSIEEGAVNELEVGD